MGGEHELQPGQLLAQPSREPLHHSRRGPHQGNSPALGGRMHQQLPGKLDAGAATHPVPLQPKGPHHAGPIGDHQICRGDG